MDRTARLILAYALLISPSWSDSDLKAEPQESASPIADSQTTATDSPSSTEPLNNNEIFQNALSALSEPENKEIVEFYQKSGNNPVWFFQGNLTKCGQIAVETMKNATQDGLNPVDYEEATQLSSHPKDWIQAEILLTRNFLKYIKHVRMGRIDPKKISHHIKFHSPPTKPAELLLEATQDPSTECKLLRHMAPNVPQYKDLKDILANYRLLATEKTQQPTLGDFKSLKLGDKSPEVKTLREILVFHGEMELPEDQSEIFDKDTEAALKQFQTRHTLQPDGVLGGKTREALNTPIKTFIRKVVINLERLRWLPDDLGERSIIVNVAGYEVRAYEKTELQLTIPAIVGKPSRRTPLFYAPLRNVIINPSWGVPYSILVHDKIPKILNDPDYIRRSGFTVTDDSGAVIDPDCKWQRNNAPVGSGALG